LIPFHFLFLESNKCFSFWNSFINYSWTTNIKFRGIDYFFLIYLLSLIHSHSPFDNNEILHYKN
jgi:hypothetical protein